MFAVREVGQTQEFGVIFGSGDYDWFSPDWVDKVLAFTGLIDDEVASPPSSITECALTRRYEFGRFRF